MDTNWPSLGYSKSQVKRAGKILRRHQTEILTLTEDEVGWAEDVARHWRRAHSEAENWAQMGCRSRLGTLEIDGRVTQRLKELTTIVAKLVREGSRVQLSTMEGIAGARAVVPQLADLRRLEQQWLSTDFPRRRHRDYVVEPAFSGYRAVHFVFRHGGFSVEVQLRTRIQHAWAELVEELGHHFGVALKNGEGSAPLLASLADLAEDLAAIDHRISHYADGRRAALKAINRLRASVMKGEW